ncbi:uncharacterized protein FIBRA_07121 [Fibroporia radiculosa]|uniref:Peroxisomal membrane protein PEX17 n=1 Tax=Fibroporia radiculosa TaxID=599839 RepID=J4H4F9_9APHY|nr:uncharacterized protein FIBRA_07121 [Fibroporia radiculosa]CCM04924.1 predicted protein [Fibroporia radiculosa]
MDRGYFVLLSYLHKPTTSLSLATVQASIAHYLANSPQVPTSLAGSIVSSVLFQPFSYAKLELLYTAFRQAVHLKVKLLQKEKGGIFSPSPNQILLQWTRNVLDGLRGGHSTLKLVCAGGLLFGLNDLEDHLRVREGRLRREVEEEAVLSLAEVLDTYSYVQFPADWAKDFKSESEDGEEPLALSLLMSSRFMPLVSPYRLQTLPLPILSSSLISTIESAFQGGRYMSTMKASLTQDSQGQIHFAATSPFSGNVQLLINSSFISSMSSLAKFMATVLSVLCDSRPSQGWQQMAYTMSKLDQLSQETEREWTSSPLSAARGEEDIAPGSRDVTKQLWTILKTQLFATLMLSQSVLSTIVFIPSPSTSSSSTSSHSSSISSFSLAAAILRTLSRLSFVIHQFGGVTSTSEGGFAELKRVFYMALDVLSASASESEQFVSELCSAMSSDGNHLFDAANREAYESAHSVMLAIFASYAQKLDDSEKRPPAADGTSRTFMEEIVPFYASCLIDNSGEGKLSTQQLCLAYAALVRSATAYGNGQPAHSRGRIDGDVLAWFCIETLLAPIHRTGGAPEVPVLDGAHLHRLRLTLIATVPSLSLATLPRLLDVCKTIITCNLSSPDSLPHILTSQRTELVRALFKEISENVGDAEKEYCLRWWYKHRLGLMSELQERSSETTVTEEDLAMSRL